MKNLSEISFIQFDALVRFKLYKRGMTIKMLSQLFGISDTELELLLKGKRRDEQAKKILRDIVNYFVKE